MTKIESHSLNLKKEWFNLNDIITNSEFAKPHKKRIRLLYQPHDIFLEADEARITQVIFNLLNNAIKFTEAKEKEEEVEGERIVSISAENTEDGNAVVTVKDSVNGIDVEILPKLFEKFASKSFQGTGLGLFISKNIVEAHDGKIWAENNSDNNDGNRIGATFRFSLPVSKENRTTSYATRVT